VCVCVGVFWRIGSSCTRTRGSLVRIPLAACMYVCVVVCTYEGVSRSFRTGRLEQEVQMIKLSATRCSYIAILWVSLVSFASINPLCCFSTSNIKGKRTFRYNSVRKLLDTSLLCPRPSVMSCVVLCKQSPWDGQNTNSYRIISQKMQKFRINSESEQVRGPPNPWHMNKYINYVL